MTMKSLVACCLVALFGCGGADETFSKPVVASKADLDPSDPLNLSCFNSDPGFSTNAFVACVYTPTAAGSSTTSRLVYPITPDNGGYACWSPGDVIWDNITLVSVTPPVPPSIPGYRTYSMTRHSAGPNHPTCTDTPRSGTIYCYVDANGNCGNTGTQWNGIYETSPIVNHTWYAYAKPAQACAGGDYYLQNTTGYWQMSVNPSFDTNVGSATLTVAPSTSSCWQAGDTMWPVMTQYGSNWVSGTRQSIGGAGRSGCPTQTVDVKTASGYFNADCSHFTEVTPWGTQLWLKL